MTYNPYHTNSTDRLKDTETCLPYGDSSKARLELSVSDRSRIIEMAWEDRTPFEAIDRLYSLSEREVILLMRNALKPKSFRNWRSRVSGRKSKHQALRSPMIVRAYCPSQYKPKGAGKLRSVRR